MDYKADYYLCKANDYNSFEKGKIYHEAIIGHYLTDHPKDWKKMPKYPTTSELLKCISSGVYSPEIHKALLCWSKFENKK
jgi:hypothetical protein